MTLTNFLKQADAITARCSAKQLALFIHDFGRVIPEHYREDFLNRLKATGGDAETTSTRDTQNEPEFHEIYKLVRDNLKTIDSQEVSIQGILNEEYEDWCDDDNEEFYFEDDCGISDMLVQACDFVHTCMDTKQYKEGFEIGNQLFSMEILCTGDYDDEEIFLGDMVQHELLQYDLMQVFLDTAYCAYHAVQMETRPEVLYSVIVNAKMNGITLETIMQHGKEELPDFQDFLTRWIAFLGVKTGDDADRLILEAVSLLNDFSAAVTYAERYVDAHPGLFLHILENEKYADVKDMISIGTHAMELISKQYMMRSRVALKTAEYMINADKNPSLLGQCYFVAYESDTSALNYLRALLNGYETKKKRNELQKVFVALSEHKRENFYYMYRGSSSHSEREENKPDGNMILLLRFLDGQFADVLAEGLNNSKALGWSGTFMKQGIALYLLYLYEGQWIGRGISEMADIVKNVMGFSAKKYCEGTYGLNAENEKKLFSEIFLQWKSVVQMEPDVRNSAIERIAELLEKRTEGIMSENRRNYYGECAAYIAALGEVQESWGEKGAKQRLMTLYRDKYSRRSAFRQEMRRYGWIDGRRN